MPKESLCLWKQLQICSIVVALCGNLQYITIAEEATTRLVSNQAQEPVTDAEEYGRGVRTTEPRTPEQELEGFHLHPGLSAELVASEPEIAKPLNVAFDWKGRLWVTQTYEYPYPYDPAKDPQKTGPKDAIVILEDADGDGYREKVTKFAEGLNIPIGLLPYRDGVICFNIPNVMFLRDTDGDSICDTREVILGPFDTTRDTHGMVNSLRWSPDGWILANHGFNNQSNVSGRDGKSVTLTSGNVFRFRPDGSSVELYAQGQVNPYGMTIDEYGTIFTADCHSKPISQVIQGGCYQSFGRPHDGLGFMPDIMSHLHGSTAIAGLEICSGEGLPSELHQQFVSGNVMTSRINRNRIVRKGLTVAAEEQPDLMTSDDPWFRPVDVRLGPDGWMYVADFYNRIIGHYEVPLTHEGRDRFRGRIWRIGSDQVASKPFAALEKFSQCIEALGSNNPTVVRLALQRIEELKAAGTSSPSALPIDIESMSPSEVAARAWANHLLGNIAIDATLKSLCMNSNDVIASNAWSVLMLQLAKLKDEESRRALKGLAEESLKQWRTRPHAALQATKLVSELGDAGSVVLLLDAILASKADDPMFHGAARIELRRLLQRDEIRTQALAGWISTDSCVPQDIAVEPTAKPAQFIDIRSEAARELFNVLVALPSAKFPSEAALAYLSSTTDKFSLSNEVLASMANALNASDAAKLFCLLETNYADHEQEHLRQLLTVAKLLKDQGKLTVEARTKIVNFINTWQLRTIARQSDDSNQKGAIAWFAHGGSGKQANDAWKTEERNQATPQGTAKFSVFSSLTLGEQYTGMFSSAPFKAPSNMSFYLCGHNGNPDQPDSKRNRVELYDAQTQEVLRTAHPPRNDTAVAIDWDLSPLAVRLVSMRVVDSDPGDAYAWIAVGGFSLAGLSPTDDRMDAERVLQLLQLLDGDIPKDVLQASAAALGDDYFQLRWHLAATRPMPLRAALGVWAFEHQHFDVGTDLARQIANGDLAADVNPSLQKLAQHSDADSQKSLIQLLALQSSWHESLLHSVKQGWVSNQSLTALSQAWWEANANQPVVAELQKLRPSESEEMKRRFERFVSLRQQIEANEGNATAGKAIFAQQCAACHQFAGQGKVVGPQLEGVGGRGLARLCEDVLVPNQNVDHAFHATAILTTEGQVFTGLVRLRDADKIVLADAKGEEQTILVADIESEKSSGASLMPENFGEVLNVQQLSDLIAYLRKPNEAK